MIKKLIEAIFGKKKEEVVSDNEKHWDKNIVEVARDLECKHSACCSTMVKALRPYNNNNVKDKLLYGVCMSKNPLEKLHHPRDSKRIWVAEKDFFMMPLHGADAITVLVPKGIKLFVNSNLPFNGYGHNDVFYEDENMVNTSSGHPCTEWLSITYQKA